MGSEEKTVQDTKRLMDSIGEKLIAQNSTIAVAESVTSGNIQAVFSIAKKTVQFFQGGITAYNLGQKCRHLSVEPTHALECNCVSKQVADQMAIQVAGLFCAGYGIGITGYASPVPELGIEDLFAYVSVAKNGGLVLSEKIVAERMEPREVQLFYTNECIRLLDSIIDR
ncbi:MAG: nicotinamide-nucleotide amidohydrolase family protein [Ferruginibacter sp.]|nr:nicotinamide-nucleotide amidohydrolase family protein [Ferruginibacter sp.]